MRSLMLHEIRVRRRTILGWTIGLAFFSVMYMAFYPAMPDEILNLDMESIDIYKSMGVQTMATFDGYVLSSVFNFMPLLVAVFGLILGTGALAGEEDSGTLEHIAALPISRLQLYVAKAAAIIVAAFVVMLAVGVALAMVFLAIESEIETSVTGFDLFRVALAHWLIAFAFLSLGLFLGAFLPSRGTANAVGTVALVLTFFGNNLAGLVTALDDVKPLFPFAYFARVAQSLTDDVPWDDVLVLLAMGIVVLVLGAVGFRRRDLTVGAWPSLLSWGGGGRVGDVASRLRAHRAGVPLAILGLAACSCVALGALAWAASDDFRQEVRDALGIDEDVVRASTELATGSVPVLATAPARVVTLPVRVGDEVAEGDVVVVLADSGTSAVRFMAQEVLEHGWALLDALAGGDEDADTDAEAIEAELVQSGVIADAADRAWREARAGGDGSGAVDDLGALAELTWNAQRIAEARLALAEERISDEDIQAVEAAIEKARSYLAATAPEPPVSSVIAPHSGTVTAILVAPTDLVAAGQPLVRLADGASLEVAIRVDEEDAERIEVGDDADIEVEDFDDPFDGKVVEVVEARDPIGDEDDEDVDDRPFVVRIAVDDPDGDLEEGLDVDVRIDLD